MQPAAAEREEDGVVERGGAREVGDLEADVVDHRAGRLVGVAMAGRHDDVLARAVARREVLDDRDGAVAPAGAADRDQQVRLALGDVLGEEVVQQRLEQRVELRQPAVAVDEVDDRWSRPVSGRSSGS